MQNYESFQAFVEALPSLAAEARDRLKACPGAFRLETLEGNVYEIEILPDGQTVLGCLTRKPDCTVTASERDLLSIIQGKLNPAKALLLRKIRVRGQITRLTALIALLN
ncbi:MAG: SCP2 sterol-binding domain-containing protein [Clostridia bacterium]|nr:SCP2 sterol-binding domain-containing protein [Clostridia bacterium]